MGKTDKFPSKGNNPLVSIVVRTRNRPVLLANALASIASQTYPNVEAVVVNDGGRDVADVIRSAIPDIACKYITWESGRGRSIAANAGLEAASGEYLNFLDDDDILYPDHVTALMTFIRETGCLAAYANVLNVYFEDAGERSGNRLKEELVFNCEFDPVRLMVENYIPLMSVLFSRKVIDKVEGFYEGLDLFEDWDFWIRVSRHFTLFHLNKTTAEYRFYENADMEALHRKKYSYDAAKAAVFDRILAALDGKGLLAVMNFFKKRTDHLENLLSECEADRLARLHSIESLTEQLKDCEADRYNRLQLIRQMEKQLSAHHNQKE